MTRLNKELIDKIDIKADKEKTSQEISKFKSTITASIENILNKLTQKFN